jgi:hypothetical protein
MKVMPKFQGVRILLLKTEEFSYLCKTNSMSQSSIIKKIRISFKLFLKYFSTLLDYYCINLYL